MAQLLGRSPEPPQKLCLWTELEDLRSSDPFYILCPPPCPISKYATTVLSIPGRVFLRPVTLGDLDAPLARTYTSLWSLHILD